MSIETREVITREQLDKGLEAFATKLRSRLDEKGWHTMCSRHEILGIMEEEMHEVRESVRSEKDTELKEELIDVAVGALYGAICVAFKKTDW